MGKGPPWPIFICIGKQKSQGVTPSRVEQA